MYKKLELLPVIRSVRILGKWRVFYPVVRVMCAGIPIDYFPSVGKIVFFFNVYFDII